MDHPYRGDAPFEEEDLPEHRLTDPPKMYWMHLLLFVFLHQKCLEQMAELVCLSSIGIA